MEGRHDIAKKTITSKYVLHTASHFNPCLARAQLTNYRPKKSKPLPFRSIQSCRVDIDTCLRHREQNLKTGAMSLFTRAYGLLRQSRSPRIMNKAWASQKAQTQQLSGGEQAIGLGVFFSVFLVPSGWVLAHLENYKSRPE
ncbi:LOW QUALITY PROTEIN: cytochrome c oxidase subunit 8A, mitochondrial [Leptodactylus fuscus]